MEVYLRFNSVDDATSALSRFSETNIKQFKNIRGICPDPRNNPKFLQVPMDFYDSFVFGSLYDFLGIPFSVEYNEMTLQNQGPRPIAQQGSKIAKVISIATAA